MLTFTPSACLYDPEYSRFLEVDPVEGGSCNDYDYVCGDPVNALDLGGTSLDIGPIKIDCPFGKDKNGGCNGSGTAKSVARAGGDALEKIGNKNWGDAAAGLVNVTYGSFKVARGVTIIAASPGCAVLGPGGVALCAGAGAYDVGTGVLRVNRGIHQEIVGVRNCTSHCSTKDQLIHFGLGISPGTQRLVRR